MNQSIYLLLSIFLFFSHINASFSEKMYDDIINKVIISTFPPLHLFFSIHLPKNNSLTKDTHLFLIEHKKKLIYEKLGWNTADLRCLLMINKKFHEITTNHLQEMENTLCIFVDQKYLNELFSKIPLEKTFTVTLFDCHCEQDGTLTHENTTNQSFNGLINYTVNTTIRYHVQCLLKIEKPNVFNVFVNFSITSPKKHTFIKKISATTHQADMTLLLETMDQSFADVIQKLRNHFLLSYYLNGYEEEKYESSGLFKKTINRNYCAGLINKISWSLLLQLYESDNIFETVSSMDKIF